MSSWRDMSGIMCFTTHLGRQVVSTQQSCWKVESASHYFTHTTWRPSQWPLLKQHFSKFRVSLMRRICPHDKSICRVDTTCPLIWVVKHYFSPGITGLKIKKILRSPFGDQMEKCMYNVNDTAHSMARFIRFDCLKILQTEVSICLFYLYSFNLK